MSSHTLCCCQTFHVSPFAFIVPVKSQKVKLKRNSLHPTGFSSFASPLCMIFNSHKYRSPLTTCSYNKILILKDMGQITEHKWDVVQFDDVVGKNRRPDMRTSRYMPNLIRLFTPLVYFNITCVKKHRLQRWWQNISLTLPLGWRSRGWIILVYQHGRLFLLLVHQYGRYDVRY